MTAVYQSHARAVKLAEKLKSYAQPQRLMILSRLLDGEHTVGDIEEATGIGQPALSQQLAELRRAALVQTRRAIKQVYTVSPMTMSRSACAASRRCSTAEATSPTPWQRPSKDNRSRGPP